MVIAVVYTSSPGDTPTRQTLEMILSASETLNDAARPRTNSVYVFTSGLGHLQLSPTSLSLIPNSTRYPVIEISRTLVITNSSNYEKVTRQ